MQDIKMKDIESSKEEERLETSRKRTARLLRNLAFLGLIALAFSLGRLNFLKSSPQTKYFAYSKGAREAIEENSKLDFKLYFEVWDMLKKDFVDKNKLSDEEMFYGSLKGLTNAAGDVYTNFLDPSETKELYEDLTGSFEGIGAEIGIRDEILTVISPLDPSPAKKAGILAGDKIYAIDGESTIGLSLNEAVKRIKGEKGTEVVLSVIHKGDNKAVDIAITRELIKVVSVKTEILEDNIYLISVKNFAQDTESIFRQAIADIKARDSSAIILDLRNNPGGYLETAINMAGYWINEGPVLIEEYGEGRREEHFVSNYAPLANYPTIVLINAGSASASEIVAGALRDYNKAKILGETSYGKGSVQVINELSSSASLKITVAKWLTPAGDYIDEKGIEPDIELELSLEDYLDDKDPQLEKAIELLKEEIKKK